MSKARPLMVQGTMSGVGKSLLTAALCRIFHQEGLRVAPFKSQNMALNSYITFDGLEMGRAQVMQAEAAGQEPDARMNPVLLKPSSDMGSQVIVGGKIRAQMTAAGYFAYKKELIPEILSAYDSLAEENDLILIEGAGGAAEINLREGDIVNMGLAELVDAPVLLVGDIDRGGVFAQLYGTVMLLPPEERKRIRGLVINMFRGDVELLRPGISMIEQKTDIPVTGVIPFAQFALDEEDSLAPSLQKRNAEAEIDIAVIRIPHIANFTDFSPLERHPLLGLRYVQRVGELGSPDLLILPGTKNTTDDMLWMIERGLDEPVKRLAAAGTPVLGVCGGYQMLGKTLLDPDLTEGSCREVEGLGLLPVTTTFGREKTRKRSRAKVLCEPFSGAEIEGYEIHTGRTLVSGEPFCVLESGEKEGCVCGSVFGTYLHGLFDTGVLITAVADHLAARKGIPHAHIVVESKKVFMEREYDRLADHVRAALDMRAVRALAGL